MLDKNTAVTLSNGVDMPLIGVGIMNLKDENDPQGVMDSAINTAVEAGYRAFDNAAAYRNEKEFGIALKKTGIDRSEVFVTTKLRNTQHQYDDALRAFDKNLENLGMDYVDLFLIHWPVPAYDRYTEAWKALEKIYKDKRARAIGVSNFFEHHMERVLDVCEIAPMVDQIQLMPYFVPEEFIGYCASKGIALTGWSPLGGPLTNEVLADPVLLALAGKYGKTVAQIIIRWSLQRGFATIPGTTKPERIKQNIDIYDFSLSELDMAEIAKLNTGRAEVKPGRKYDPDENIFWF